MGEDFGNKIIGGKKQQKQKQASQTEFLILIILITSNVFSCAKKIHVYILIRCLIDQFITKYTKRQHWHDFLLWLE